MPKPKAVMQQQVGKSTNRRQRKNVEAAESVQRRKVTHSEIVAEIRAGKEAITASQAKELLGWEEETEKSPFGQKFMLKHGGKKIRLNNNVTNRPIYNGTVDMLKQEHLRRRWQLNGEPIIIGRTGLVLNGQHTLIGLILAADEWAEDKTKWPDWKSEPVMEKLIVFGVKEDDDTVNTMDTCKPRSLTDVIYRAPYFKALQGKAQRIASKLTENAIKMLWHRTGIHSNAFAVRRTHSESIAFLNNHPKILDCVKHIYEEDNNEGKIGKWISPGYAAAMLYLMASSETDPGKYYAAETPTEELVEFKHWDRATQFFVELAAGADSLKAARAEIGKLVEQGGGSHTERWAVLTKAWNEYVEKKTVTPKVVKLEFNIGDGERHLAESPLLGGLDVGEEGVPYTGEEADKQEAEAKDRKKAVREKKFPEEKKENTASRAGDKWAKGDRAWVHDEFEEVELVTLKDDPFETVSGWDVHVDASDGDYIISVNSLSLAQFEKKS